MPKFKHPSFDHLVIEVDEKDAEDHVEQGWIPVGKKTAPKAPAAS